MPSPWGSRRAGFYRVCLEGVPQPEKPGKGEKKPVQGAFAAKEVAKQGEALGMVAGNPNFLYGKAVFF
jgi:hypothetical protein